MGFQWQAAEPSPDRFKWQPSKSKMKGPLSSNCLNRTDSGYCATSPSTLLYLYN